MGSLSEQESLSFSKTYAKRPSIEYKFSFDKERGLYLGAWKGVDAFNGYAGCRLDDRLIQPDVDFMWEHFGSFDGMTDEERAREIMDYMVGKEYLSVSIDQTSGKEMVSLSEKGKRLAEEAGRTMTPEEKSIVNDVLRQADEEDDTSF